MTLAELHTLLTSEFDLVADGLEKGNARSYFWMCVVRNPASTTRIARVRLDEMQTVTQIRLCVSSDNNNSVFLPPPFEPGTMRAAIAGEITLLRQRQNTGSGRGP